MNPICDQLPSLKGSVAVGPWTPVGERDCDSRGAMVTSDPLNTGPLLVLTLPYGGSPPSGNASADFPNVWTLRPGGSIYGRGLSAKRAVYVGTTAGTPNYEVHELPDAPPGIGPYGGDPISPYGQHWVAAPASWLTGTPWNAASSSPLPAYIKSLLVILQPDTSCHLEFDGGGQTNLSISPIPCGRFPFYPGIAITQIYPPAAGQGVTGLIVEF